MKHNYIFFSILGAIAVILQPAQVLSKADDKHAHGHSERQEKHESHAQEADAHNHSSKDGAHEKHSEDNHQSHGHSERQEKHESQAQEVDAHNHSSKDGAQEKHSGDNHQAHGHSEDNEKHGDHNGTADNHDEEKTTISPAAAKRMGIKISKATPVKIDKTVSLSGRIALNANTKTEIRARFPGIVRAVKVNLAEKVKKGQVLAVVESNESLKTYNVTAPIDGTILERNTNIGDVANGNLLFLIADLTNVWAKFHIFPQHADSLMVGQKVAVHTLEGKKETVGQIDTLLPTADALSQTLIAIVGLSNTSNIWKPGMVIEGDVTVSKKHVNVAIKDVALHVLEERGDVVFAVDGHDYKVRPVKVGYKGSGFVEILEGLVAGEQYAAEGSFIIKSDLLKSTAAHSH